MAFQTMYNPFDPIPVVKDPQSKTVPDMAFTPREIIAKFSRGEQVPLGMNGLFDEDGASAFEDDPTRRLDFDKCDYAELSHELEERGKEESQKRKRKAQHVDESKDRKSETQNDQASATE